MRRISTCAVVVGAFIAVASLQSYAAGLGRLEVKSVLGEPLRAEVAVSAKPEEVRSLQARLASPSAYEAAGLVYTDIVSQLSVTLRKDDGGEPSLTVSSSGPVNEPVVDLLLELTWASGRVTREYTAFIDPPFIVAEREKRRVEEEMAAADAARAARGPETRPAEVPDAPTPQPLPSAVAEGTAPDGQAVQEPAVAAAEEEQMAPVSTEQTRQAGPGTVETIGGTDPTLFTAAPTVSAPVDTAMAPETDEYGAESVIGVIRGDTLSSIALARKPEGVSLEQMLVVLFRNNPEAFSGNNMNRLRTGKVIRLPNPAEYSQLNVQQARKEVRVQYADWNAYRERVAAAATQQPAAEQPAQQAAAGTVTPRIEDRAPAAGASSSEVVKLSRGEPATGQGGGQANVKALEEQLVAKEKALEESNARVARLEKIIEDLQKLAEVKNEGMAQVQSQAAAVGQAPAQAPAVEKQPAQAPGAAAPPAKSEQAPQVAAPGTQASEAATAPQSGAPAASPATAPPPANAPKRRPPPPPPPPPSLVDQLMEQPYLLAVPVVILLLVGFGVSRLRKRKREAKSGTEEVAPASSRDESSGRAPATQSFSPTRTNAGLGAGSVADSDEVDPLEEAEIFLAYGRDAQAEELLKEAMESHPARYEIHGKLAEIYARRGDKKAFESLARDVQQGTGGRGDVWTRVVALGYSLDPANPRYAEGKTDDEDGGDMPSRVAGMTSTTDRIDFEVGGGGDRNASTDFDPSERSGFGADTDLDATIDESFAMDNDPTTIQIRSNSGLAETDLDLSSDAGLTATDLDLGSDLPDLYRGTSSHEDDSTMDLSMDADAELEKSTRASGGADKDDDAGLEFNMDGISFDSGGDGEAQTKSGSSFDMPALDLSGISLDLDGASGSTSGSGDKDDKWYEVQTKFDLAKAYQEMGDKDGAREILQEVISEGDSEQKAAAESVLASLD